MLKLRIENLGPTAILHVIGHIVIGAETEVLRRAVASQTHVSAVALDLARVSRIDAHGLGVLLQLREQLESRGTEFRLVNVSNLVQQILRMTCLDSVFEIAREGEILSRDSLEPILETAIS